jgi:GNAT superfamily N-acetyltransferase
MPSVSPAEPTDIPAIAALLEEMDRFYGKTEFAPLEDRMAEIKANLFDNCVGLHVLLARRQDEVAGLASYSYLWPAVGITRSLYLKDLYVRTSHRRQGIGKVLMVALTSIAAESGCSRLEWTTDQDNADAQSFYTELGFKPLPTKVFYRSQGRQPG